MTNGSALSGRPHTWAIWENRREQVAMARSTARPSSARLRTAFDDRELAELATAGDGEAFAQLYDRHERRVYGYCLRMLGAPDEAGDATQETFMRLLGRLPALEGRDVNFIAYALTTARNVCYDAIEARRRVQPVAEPIDRSTTTMPATIGRHAGEPSEIALDPERAALLAAAREDVRAANARLPERQREVLALRELEQLSYEQIGEVVDLNENAVAQLISRARIRLREELRGDALGSIAASSPDCERALPLLARLQDVQTGATDELDWLYTHIAGCETCRLSRAAMEEAGASYRALGPIVVLAWLRHATIAHAAQFVGADWSHVAGSVGAQGATPPSAPASGAHRKRLAAAALGVCLLAIVAVLLAASVAPDGRVVPQHLTLNPRAVTAAHTAGRRPAHLFKAVHRANFARNPASRSYPPGQAGALAAVARAPAAQVLSRMPATHHERRVAHHKAKHRTHSSPPAPASGTPAPQPPSTTPTTPAPAPNPPSGGPSESTGSGSGASTGSGETPPPAETPVGPPGGGGTETTPGCVLAIAC